MQHKRCDRASARHLQRALVKCADTSALSLADSRRHAHRSCVGAHGVAIHRPCSATRELIERGISRNTLEVTEVAVLVRSRQNSVSAAGIG